MQFVLRPSPKSGSGEAPLEDIDRYLTSFRVGACSFLLALRIFKKKKTIDGISVCVRVCVRITCKQRGRVSYDATRGKFMEVHQ